MSKWPRAIVDDDYPRRCPFYFVLNGCDAAADGGCDCADDADGNGCRCSVLWMRSAMLDCSFRTFDSNVRWAVAFLPPSHHRHRSRQCHGCDSVAVIFVRQLELVDGPPAFACLD